MNDTRSTSDDGRLVRLVFWGLVAVVAWVPLPLASNRPWAWSLLALGIGALLTGWAVATLTRRHLVRLGWARLGVPMVLLGASFLWFMVQASPLAPSAWHAPLWDSAAATLGLRSLPGAISVDPAASAAGAMRLLAYGGVFWLAAQYGRDPDDARRLLWAVSFITFAYALYGLVAHLSGNETILWFAKWAYRGDLTATFVNRNAWGIYAGIGTLTVLTLMVRLAERSQSAGLGGRTAVIHFFDRMHPAFWALAFAWVTLATALALSHSRGALASTVLGTAVLLGGLSVGTGWRERRRGLAIAALLLIAAGFAVIEVSGRGTLGRIVALAGEGTGREPIHALVWRAIADTPWTGRGLDTFPQVFYAYRDSSIPWDSPRYDKAHGAFLELALEAGWIAFAAIVAALAWVIGVLAVGVVRRRRRAIYPCLGLAASALVGVQAIYDFGIQMPAIAVTYFTLMGVAFAQSFRTR
jgi:O-antigen ligase